MPDRSRLVRRALGAAIPALAMTVSMLASPASARPIDNPATANPAPVNPVTAAFATAAARYQVPRDLLVALGYGETHLDDHAGAPSASGGYGVMHLVTNPTRDALGTASRLTGIPAAQLRTDLAANVLGAAALLRSYADDAGLDAGQRADLNNWYPMAARYGAASTPAVARLYADTVYDILLTGVTAPTKYGEVRLAGRPVAPRRGDLAEVAPVGSASGSDVGIQSTDYGPALWTAASTSNYTVANRPSQYPVNYVVIHVTQGSYAGTISWFQNPSSQVSAHYVVRSSDGQITQMVREKDVAWHAGNWTYNTQSIGIEHEGFVDDASWFTDAMYRSSAALTRNICDKYGIPKDRSHIIGHVEVPGATHTDPGPYWNWSYYMQLVTGSTAWSTVVDNNTAGRFTASANWGVSTLLAERYGADYRYANPVLASDPAWYKVNIPATATYQVEVWYASGTNKNNKTPYLIVTPTGNAVVYVDQRVNGGRWVTLGTFTIAAGDANVVGVSRWTDGTGYVIADAVKLTRV